MLSSNCRYLLPFAWFFFFFKSYGSECTYNSVVWNKMMERWKRKSPFHDQRMVAGNRSNKEVRTVAERAGAKRKTALYSMETSPRHGQERSRKQRGLWINKFCELILNASPKALVNKTFTWGLFFAQLLSFWPYCAISFCVCAKYLFPTQLFCIADFFCVST